MQSETRLIFNQNVTKLIDFQEIHLKVKKENEFNAVQIMEVFPHIGEYKIDVNCILYNENCCEVLEKKEVINIKAI